MNRRLQTAYDAPRTVENDRDVNARIHAAMFAYLRDDLGLSEDYARQRARVEIDRDIAKTVIAGLRASGVEVEGREIIELGGGLGGLSVELASQGAFVICVEPGKAWRELAATRLQEQEAGSGWVVGAVGEFLPVASASVDMVVSLQVLEHVQQPEQVIAEVYRVLKPGGVFYFACENYLAFREQHYRVAWFPLLPKSIGALYLRSRGRSPKFLREAVTYTTRPGVIRALKRAGFSLASEEAVHRKLENPTAVTSPARRALVQAASMIPASMRERLVTAAVIGRRLFGVGIYELCFKR